MAQSGPKNQQSPCARPRRTPSARRLTDSFLEQRSQMRLGHVHGQDQIRRYLLIGAELSEPFNTCVSRSVSGTTTTEPRQPASASRRCAVGIVGSGREVRNAECRIDSPGSRATKDRSQGPAQLMVDRSCSLPAARNARSASNSESPPDQAASGKSSQDVEFSCGEMFTVETGALA